MPFYKRRRKVNPNDKTARIDFVDQNGDTWQEYFVLHPKFKSFIELKYKNEIGDESIENLHEEDLKEIFQESPWYNSTANDIDWIERVEIQSIIQKYITHSISSTINLPSDVSLKHVSDIYFASYKKGLKGITVYRDGSRTGVLVSNKESNKKAFEQHDAPKRPKELNADIHVVSVKGFKYNVIVGLYEDKPYEVFAHANDGTSVKSGSTILTKHSKGEYSYSYNQDNIFVTYDMSDEEEAITRLVSTSLRHGADIKFIADQLNKTTGDITSFSKAIARVLRKYIGKEEVLKETCSECGSSNLVREEGCLKCLDCGHSKCS